MEKLNNLYNFKNPIRHFFNLDNVSFDGVDNLNFDNLTWTEPVKFKIFKTNNSCRTISFPNILNFYHTIKHIQQEDKFYDIKSLSSKKRVNPCLDTGDFSVLSYSNAIKKDFFNLTKFDKLLIMDIKSFYGRIYTHELEFTNTKDNLEQRVTSLNSGKTNGLLLGSYLSLYLAERFLLKIENDLNKQLLENNIDCHYEYFSDDFYFFCNDTNVDKIKDIFAKVLDTYELQANEEKIVILDFDEYSQNNNLEKLWNKIINMCYKSDKFGIQKEQYVPFLTQLIYRLKQITDIKYRRIFLVNFFKTNYFFKLKPEKFKLSPSDFNYICYIYKIMPEAILYSLCKIKKMTGFNSALFKEFIVTRLKSALNTQKYEEQLYYYYAIKVCEFDDVLVDFKDAILSSKNQILISYLLLDKIITKNDYSKFLTDPKEGDWLQNYHYLLTYDKSRVDILMPQKATKEKTRDSYNNFYKNNINKDISLLTPIKNIDSKIQDYLSKKIESYKKLNITS